MLKKSCDNEKNGMTPQPPPHCENSQLFFLMNTSLTTSYIIDIFCSLAVYSYKKLLIQQLINYFSLKCIRGYFQFLHQRSNTVKVANLNYVTV